MRSPLKDQRRAWRRAEEEAVEVAVQTDGATYDREEIEELKDRCALLATHLEQAQEELNLSIRTCDQRTAEAQASVLSWQLRYEALDKANQEQSATITALQDELAKRDRTKTEWETKQAKLLKQQTELKNQLRLATATLEGQLDDATKKAARLALERDQQLAQVQLTHDTHIQALQTAHAAEMATLRSALESEKSSLAADLGKAKQRHQMMLHELSTAEQAADEAARQLNEVTSAWTQKVAAKTTALDMAHRQIEEQEATILQLKLAASEIKITEQHEAEATFLHQIAALEAALAQANARLESSKEQHDLAMRLERDRVAHVVAQAKSVADELETANLCLAERKRQREQDQQAFEERERRAAASIAQLMEEVDRLRQKPPLPMSDLEVECRQVHKHNDDLVKQMQALKEQLQAQHAASKEGDVAVQLLEAQKRDLQHRLDLAVATAQELQRQLHDKTTQVAASMDEREQELEARLNQRLAVEKRLLQKQQLDMDAETQSLMEDKQLLAQVVERLVERLRLQLDVLALQADDKGSAKVDWTTQHAQWQRIHDQCANADWQLSHMKARLDELVIARRGRRSMKQSPFSDAIAAGHKTVDVADQIVYGSQNESDSYAAALAKEMHAMKASYEAKLAAMAAELKRLQTEPAKLDDFLDGRSGSAARIKQLEDQCAALEASLAAHVLAKRSEKDEEVDLICKCRVERDGKAKAAYLEALLECRAKACSDDVQRRVAFEALQRKLRK
ncbi:hypothetical protein AeMF1_020671 [Aphanomyces euteiches]|nr:hypothetical protein AeMF1_020671 [Aphanomyces euteiches]